MTAKNNGKISDPTQERMAAYRRLLIELEQSHADTISSAEVERQTGINAAQFREDLAFFGDFGRPNADYGIVDLQKQIKKMLKNSGKVPVPALERLATYLRFLVDLEQSHVDTISSAEVERQTGINAAQFRKDLSYFYPKLGEFGKPGVGYNVSELQARIARILKIDREQRVILVGAGNLGSALVGYPGLKEHRFNLVAVFDNNFGKIGRPLWDMEIYDVARIKEINRQYGAQIAILAVPANAAQNVAEMLVAAGVHAILNFAPVMLRVPDYVFVRNVSFLQELAVLSYHLSGETLLAQREESDPEADSILPLTEERNGLPETTGSHAPADRDS